MTTASIVGVCLCGVTILAILLIVLVTYVYNPELATFYQIWLKEEFLTENFIIMSGYSKKHKLVTHNCKCFRSDKYKWAILPFINEDLTNKDIIKLIANDEANYIKMCRDMTKTTLESK